MDCKKEVNNKFCNCTADCPHHGICCECIAHHRPDGVPACYFSKEGEAKYDRSIDAFLTDRKGK